MNLPARIRRPEDVALALRETARLMLERPAGETIALGAASREAFATLFHAWADILAPRPVAYAAAVERLSTEPTLSIELETLADWFESERGLSGDGTVYLESAEAFDHVAWLREQARRAAALEIAAKGFVLDADARREAAIAAGMSQGLVALLRPRRDIGAPPSECEPAGPGGAA